MTDYIKEKLFRLLLNFKPIEPVPQPTHWQTWDIQQKRRKRNARS